MRRVHSYIGAGVLALALALGACVGTTEPTASVRGFTVAPSSALLAVGDTVRITPFMSPPDLVPGGLAAVTWTSSDTHTATVTGGLVKGLAAGQATILATAGSYHAVANVRVVGP